MKKSASILLTLMTLLTACGGGSRPAEQASPAGADTKASQQPLVLDFKDAFSLDYHEKIVTVEGYMKLTQEAYALDYNEMFLVSRPNQWRGKSIELSLEVGTDHNQMNSPKMQNSWESLVVIADDGSKLAPDQKIRVTGKLAVIEGRFAESNMLLQLNVSKLEAASSAAFDYKAAATEVNAENQTDKSLEQHFATAQGKLAIPDTLVPGEGIVLAMKLPTGKIYCQFRFGDGPNFMDKVPDHYTNRDIKIRDANGKLVNINKPVRVFGNRTPPQSDGFEGYISVERIEQ
jgi:hypothetical protein